MWDKFADFFTIKDSDTYSSTKKRLNNIREHISDVLIVFPDVSIAELVFLQDKWQDIPKTIGDNIRMFGLSINKDIKTLLTVFDEGSEIFEHTHVNNYEFIYVLNGSISIMLGGNIISLNKGQSIIIDVGEKHKISSLEGASAVTCYSTNKDDATLSKKDIKNLLKFNEPIV